MIDMGLGVEVTMLRRFAPLFVETVEQWRKIVGQICEGKDPDPFTLPSLEGKMPGGMPGAGGMGGMY